MRRDIVAMRSAALLLPSVAVMATGISACSSEECLENKNSLPFAGFYTSQPVPEAISLDSLTIYGLGAPGDSLLHDSVRNISQTYLPFRIDEERSSFVIRYLQEPFGDIGLADTITFRYDIIPYFVSSACGAVYEYRMRSIATTNHLIDSVTCPEGIITNMNAENIRIYFRVALSDEDQEN